MNELDYSQGGTAGRPAEIDLGEGLIWRGRVVGEMFVLDDEIHNGTSYFALTHSHPRFKPIPLADIEKKGDTIQDL